MLSDETMHLLTEHQLALAIDGMLISLLVWCWTARRYQGFVADEMRLLLLTLLTAGVPGLGDGQYVLFWASDVLGSKFISWPGMLFVYLAWWFGYSLLFHWARWFASEVWGE